MMPRVPLVEAVGQGRRGRLVDDAQDIEPGNAAGIARRGALGVVEIGGHGDHRAIDVRIDFALCGEMRLGAVLQLAQDEGRDLGRGEFPIAESDLDDAAGVAADLERKETRLVADVVDALAHEPLHRVDGAARIGQQPPLRLASDEHRPSSATETTDGTRPSPLRSRITTGTPSLT